MRLILALCVLLAGGVAGAADDERWLSAIGEIERQLEQGRLESAVLGKTVERIAGFNSQATRCIQEHQTELAKVEDDLAAIGDANQEESREVRRGRSALQTEKADIERTITGCRLAQLRSGDLLTRLGKLQQKALTEQLLARGPRIDELLLSQASDPRAIWQQLRGLVTASVGLDRLEYGAMTLVYALLPGLLIGLPLGRAMRRQAKKVDTSRSLAAGLGRAMLAGSGNYLPYLLCSLGVTLATVLFIDKRPLSSFQFQLAASLSAYFLVALALSFLLLPRSPAKPYLPLDEGLQRALGRRLEVLAILGLLGALLYAATLSSQLPQDTLLLLRAIYAPFVALNVIWITWLISRATSGRLRWLAGPLLSLVVVACLLAEWLGLRNLSVFVLRGLLVTLFGLGLIWLATFFLRDLYDGLDHGVERWQRWLRARMRLRPDELMPGVFWLRSVTGLVLWGTFALAQLRVWGMSDSGFSQMLAVFSEGFRIGEFTIVPERMLYAVLTLAAILLFIGWFKRQLEQRWLLKSRLNHGAREAVVTTTGYAGVAVAIFAMLSVIGVEFANVAIIAGALSVGIGFGLQNIVNNFVSGLILLMERPIRTGDWVVVGNTEGYVRRISIRSTLIETFDRADVIVPNSELISGQVTNWMLRDPYGRARIPIGVAYGSDTEQVRELLLELASAHPDVVTNVQGVIPPKVFFMGFGDSALNLELRVFIRQVDSRMRVISELNFAIDAAFRRAGIEIPFPQRDLHVKDLPSAAGHPAADPGESRE